MRLVYLELCQLYWADWDASRFRICPGRHFAHTTLFMLLSCVLHTYWISPPTDENGDFVPVDVKMTPGVISYVVLAQSLFVRNLLIR